MRHLLTQPPRSKLTKRWCWQLWHRDSVGGQPVSNFTNGISVNFE